MSWIFSSHVNVTCFIHMNFPRSLFLFCIFLVVSLLHSLPHQDSYSSSSSSLIEFWEDVSLILVRWRSMCVYLSVPVASCCRAVGLLFNRWQKDSVDVCVCTHFTVCVRTCECVPVPGNSWSTATNVILTSWKILFFFKPSEKSIN